MSCFGSGKKKDKPVNKVPYKIILIGDANVGKSSLLHRFCEGVWKESGAGFTIVDFKPKTITINDKTISLQVWDTAGMERLRSITNNFYRGAHGILLVYDVNEAASFTNIKLWMQEITRYAEFSSKILVGNKVDLDGKRAIETAQGRSEVSAEAAGELRMPFIETSAKTGHEVDNAFLKLMEGVLTPNPTLDSSSSSSPPVQINDK